MLNVKPRCTVLQHLLLAGLLLLCCAAAAAATNDPYKVLGVSRFASQQEITQAFRRLSREWHPDKNRSPDATEKFQEISAAYEYLTDPKTASLGGSGGQDFFNQWATGSGPDRDQATIHINLNNPGEFMQQARSWMRDYATKHWENVQPIWNSPVDKSVCWCLANVWRLPGLAEPMQASLAQMQGRQPVPDSWKAWRLTGTLIELSAWAARQTPCWRYNQPGNTTTQSTEPNSGSSSSRQHSSGSSSSENGDFDADQRHCGIEEGSGEGSGGAACGVQSDRQEASRLLQQRFKTVRLQRQEAIMTVRLLQQQQQQQTGGRSSEATGDSRCNRQGSSSSFSEGPDKPSSVGLMQGCVVWAVLMLAVVWMMQRDWLLLVVATVLTQAAVWATVSGGLVASECDIQKLAAIMGSDGIQASLIGLWFLAVVLSLGLLLPLVLAGTAARIVLWIWGAIWCISVAMLPATAQAGFALAIPFKVITAAAGVLQGMVVVAGLAYCLYQYPKVRHWWFSALLVPTLFIFYFVMEVFQSCLCWPPSSNPSAGTSSSSSNSNLNVGQRAASSASAQPAAAVSKGNSRSRSSSSRSEDKQPLSFERLQELLPPGPWLPSDIGPAALAATCHWYTSLLGWHLARRALAVAAISCKLAVLSALCGITAAGFGVPVGWLTVSRLVKLVLLRVGPAVGIVQQALLLRPWLQRLS